MNTTLLSVEQSERTRHRPARIPHVALIVAGGAVWLAALVWIRPSPFQIEWARLLLMLAPLILIPLGLRLTWTGIAAEKIGGLHHLVTVLQFPSALLLGWSMSLPQGWSAVALASPWLATTALVAAIGGIDAQRNRRGPIWQLCMDAGLMFLVVGGGWAVVDRSGWRPLGFEPAIVLLTDIHFHFAGFVLPIATGLAARALPGSVSRLACVGVVAGMPLVAIGITATQLGYSAIIESLAAGWMAVSGAATAALHLRLALQSGRSRPARILWAVSAAALACGMLLAGTYGLRHIWPVAGIEIPWMRATHGTIIALGFALPVLLAWAVESHRLEQN